MEENKTSINIDTSFEIILKLDNDMTKVEETMIKLSDEETYTVDGFCEIKKNNFYSSLDEKGNVMKLQKQITNEELLELTRKAFENDEVAEFLCGEKGYSVMGNRDIPINIPTDFGRIVEKGIYELYLTTNDEVIIKKFRKAIMTLNSTPIQVWCAYMACWNQIFNEHSKYPAPFKMIDDTLLKTLKSTLINNESSLRNCKEWMGINKKNGLWDYIIRIDNVLKKDYGVSVL